MKSKKKLIIALSSFAFVLVAAVVTVVAVLAAANQAINTNVSVVYYSKQVAGTVSATYQVGDKAAVSMTTTGKADGSKVITYEGSEKPQTDSLLPLEVIELFAVESTDATVAETVTFTYTFTNNGSANYTATLEYNDTGAEDDNVLTVYGSELTDNEDGTYSVVVPSGTTAEEPVTVTITVSIKHVAFNAEFSGTFGWALEGSETGRPTV